jgi:hypothetical protein
MLVDDAGVEADHEDHAPLPDDCDCKSGFGSRGTIPLGLSVRCWSNIFCFANLAETLVEDAGVEPLHDDQAPVAGISYFERISKRFEDVANEVGLKLLRINYHSLEGKQS